MKPTAANGDAMLESVRFGLGPHRLMESASSFTALLELPPTQAMKLIGSPEPTPAILTADVPPLIDDVKPYFHPFDGNLTFPSNAALIERAAKFSVFAIENNSPESTSVPSMKSEPMETDNTPPEQLVPEPENKRQKAAKRKEHEKKGKESTKKSKNETEKLPYVHVRARRGQATNSHSLAERARREKINARMKLLQELVPGCNKISGMTLVLDEIINHVQSLQHQVEFLSMRLAQVNPRVDFSILAAQSGSPIFPGVNGNRQE